MAKNTRSPEALLFVQPNRFNAARFPGNVAQLKVTGNNEFPPPAEPPDPDAKPVTGSDLTNENLDNYFNNA